MTTDELIAHLRDDHGAITTDDGAFATVEWLENLHTYLHEERS